MHQRGLEAARALPTEGATPEEGTPTGAEQTDAATTEVDSFTNLDPNSLPAELRPYYTSMQADYTRKTQEVAPFRQLAQDTGLDVEGLRQSAELYSVLQDPEQLVSFYSELSTALEAQGLSPAQAEAAATQHIQQAQGGEDPYSELDPEEKRIQALESRLADWEKSQQEQLAAIQREQLQVALVGEMNRQESVVRESYPAWDQDDFNAVYELAPFHGGSLIDAANRYDEIVTAKVTKILNGKGAAASNPALAPLPGAVAGLSRGMEFGDNLDAAHRAAMEAAALLPDS